MISTLVAVLSSAVFLVLSFGIGTYCSRFRHRAYSLPATITLGCGTYLCGALIGCPLGVPIKIWIGIWTVLAIALFPFGAICSLSHEFKILCDRVKKRWDHLIIFVCLLVAFANRVEIVLSGSLNITDDDLAYIPLVLSALQRATLFDEFCFRSSGSYGGQLILQSFGAFFSSVEGYQVTELISFYLIAIMFTVRKLFGSEDKPRTSILIVPIALILIWSSGPNVNGTSIYTAIVFLFLLAEVTGAYLKSEVRDPPVFEISVALISLASLRNIYLLWSIFFIITLLLHGSYTAKNRRVWLIPLVYLLALLPVAIQFYEFFGTFLVTSPSSDHFSKTVDLYPRHSSLADYAIMVFSVTNSLAFLTFILLWLGGPKSVILYFTIPSFSLWLGFAFSEGQMRPEDIFRYNYPMFYALTVMCLCQILQQGESSAPRNFHVLGKLIQNTKNIIGAPFCFALFLLPMVSRIEWPGKLPLLSPGKFFFSGVTTTRSLRLRHVDLYEQAYRSIPSGSKILSATTFPHFFDFSRNKIVLVDIPGVVGPTPEALDLKSVQHYIHSLKKEGIDYIIANDYYADNGGGIYSSAYWNTIIGGNWHKDMLFLTAWQKQVDIFYGMLAQLPHPHAIQLGNSSLLIYDLSRIAY